MAVFENFAKLTNDTTSNANSNTSSNNYVVSSRVLTLTWIGIGLLSIGLFSFVMLCSIILSEGLQGTIIIIIIIIIIVFIIIIMKLLGYYRFLYGCL